MMATIVPFIPVERSPTSPVENPRVLPFLTMQEFALRELDRLCKAYEEWLLRKWALPPGAPIEEPPLDDFGLTSYIGLSLRWRRRPLHLFETVLRTPPPHPVWRVVRWCGRSVCRVLSRLQTVLLAYYALLGLTAFPLLAQAHWLGGAAMAMVGSFFGWLLFARWQLRATCRRRMRNMRLLFERRQRFARAMQERP
jgi:hypothetical protein